MLRGAFEGWHIVIILALLIILFGFKRLPDAARSLGRSMRIFKSEVNEMKHDGKSAASSDTVKGETIKDETPPRQDTAPREETSPREGNSSGLS
jgi:sec-independent protein translocase protein TatA